MTKNNNRIFIGYIYLITNKINGKTYVGQRFCPKDKTPWTDTSYMGSGKILVSSQKKRGIKNFTKEILAICHSPDILNFWKSHTYLFTRTSVKLNTIWLMVVIRE